jgi:hypothetical protein
MKEPFTHVDRCWPLTADIFAEDAAETEEEQKEEGEERQPAFSPLYLKLIGSYEK